MKICPACQRPFASPSLYLNSRLGIAVRGGRMTRISKNLAKLLDPLIQAAGKPVPHIDLRYALWADGDGPTNERHNLRERISALRTVLQGLGVEVRSHYQQGYSLHEKPFEASEI